MPITLEQAKLAAQDAITAGVIDEFRKESVILDRIVFDDAVTPGTTGASLVYGYTRLVTQPTAEFRGFNEEYAPQEVTTQRVTVELRPFGGAFEIDRVLAGVGGLYDNVALQLQQKVKAARALFHDAFINGDSGVDDKAFDGLDKAIAGSSTELGTEEYVDLSDENAMEANKWKLLDVIDELLAELDDTPTLLCVNRVTLLKIRSVARRAGYWAQDRDEFGRVVEYYNGIPIVDLGSKPGSDNPIIPITSRDIGGQQITGLTDLYAVRLGLDACHGVSMAGQPLVRTWLPDFSTAGAVKRGEVEMVAAVALKRTKAAGVRRNFKVK